MTTPGVTRISGYDGSNIWLQPGSCLFEIGSYIGQGVAGTVYECTHVSSHVQYAIKILHPLGYKINSPQNLKKFHVLLRGRQYDDSSKSNRASLVKEDIWWLLNSSSKTYIPAYYSSKDCCLKELSLNQCMDIWGAEPAEADAILNSTDQSATMEAVIIPLTGQKVYLPKLPPKYLEFVGQRKRIFREINNMRKMSAHPNIIRLEGVLELVQESKDVIFLVMELANAGELFDRIKVDNGAREETAKFFFRQLVIGVKHCHEQGVCHRDLKPENLLLQDTNGGDMFGFILKIADFGLSTRFLMQNDSSHMDTGSPTQNNLIRELKSVVGSPHYVAPEVLQERGYDGTKADIWSLGVILYAMLAGSLPFESNMQTCPRYTQFCKWILSNPSYEGISLWNYSEIEYPNWFFGPQFSPSAKGLIISMLHPDPLKRITIDDVFKHPLAARSAHSNIHDSHSTILQSYNVGEESKSSPASPQSPDSYHLNSANIAAGGFNSSNNGSNNNNNNSSSADSKTVTASSLSEDNEHLDYSENELGDSSEFMGQRGRGMVKLDFELISLEDNRDMQQTPQHLSKKSSDSDLMFAMEDDEIGSNSNNNNSNSNSNCNSINNKYVAISDTRVTSDSVFSFSQHCRNSSRDNVSAVHMSGGNKPPLAPTAITNATPASAIDDLITSDDESHGSDNSFSSTGASEKSTSGDARTPKGSKPLPFHSTVKKWTRFITAVPAADVLCKMEGILESYRADKVATPAGIISKVVVNWETFTLEVYDCNSACICAIHIYQLPSSYSAGISYSSSPVKPSGMMFGSGIAESPVRQPLFGSPVFNGDSYLSQYAQPDLFLVEFARNQIDMFAFQRFYQRIRQQVSALVKKDYPVQQFDQYGASPSMNKYDKEMLRLS